MRDSLARKILGMAVRRGRFEVGEADRRESRAAGLLQAFGLLAPHDGEDASEWGSWTATDAGRRAEGRLPRPRLRLARVRIDRGGYERPHGRYYGVGEPLWRAWDPTDPDFDAVELRAPDREAAKAKIPGVRFYR